LAFPKTLLVGARGVGKSALLKRWPDSETVFDLDLEIERQEGRSISKIFQASGELYFRGLEHKLLNTLLLDSRKMVIALGAGFDWETYKFPIQRSQVEIIWVRRSTDKLGRIFLDRPRLNKELSDLEEFQLRHKERMSVYASVSDRVYTLPEGLSSSDTVETEILKNQMTDTSGILTLSPGRLSWNWSGRVEIRTDLWSFEELAQFQHSKILWSVRDLEKSESFKIKKDDWLDWALELGTPLKTAEHLVVSLHEGSLQDLMEVKAWHYKYSPLVHSWKELEQGWEWQQQDPENRSFLPRSQNGRWSWFRLWSKGHQKINFVQDGTNPVEDQPTFYQWGVTPAKFSKFAAVLGDPVFHSHSPVEQAPFFKKWSWPFFAIPLSPEDWSTALPFLRKLGLQAAAVTSPLKLQMNSEKSLNTLIWDSEDHWEGANTDFEGLNLVLAELLDSETLIWGGGGTLSSLLEILPGAAAYSCRTGELKNSKECLHPKTLIWAAGPRDSSPDQKGHQAWQPQLVIDLNYREDSEARSYALTKGAKYQSGELLFRQQALGQRNFWNLRIKS
jgi:shikimate kinase/shikimate 5-dehydrogenase